MKTTKAPKKAVATDPLGTRKDAAHDLGVCLRTIDALILTKEIPVYRIGRAVRLDLSEVREALRDSDK